MAAPRRRRYVGRLARMGHQERVYRTDEAIEIDELEGYDVTRRRVYYDDVLLVSAHEQVGWSLAVVGIVLALLSGALCGLILQTGSNPTDRAVAGGLFACTGLPMLLLALARLVRPVLVVTVFGRRSKAQVQFWVRKGKGRAFFEEVCRAVRAAQSRPDAA